MFTNRTERRRYPRYEVSVRADLAFRSSGSLQHTTTVDLGPEGARFTTPKPVQPGEPVIVLVRLDPHTEPHECKARVCWSAPMTNGRYAFGVRFVDLNDRERECLTAYLNERAGAKALV